MTLMEIINAYWKEGLIYLIIGAGLIQITPIKLNPYSWLAKKIGNALNAEMMSHLEESNKTIANIAKRLEDHIKENAQERMDECRVRILSFNERAIAGEKITKERYDAILDDIDKYEKYCRENPDYPNSKAVLSIANLKRDYAERYRDKIV